MGVSDSICAIGFSGHRELANVDLVKEKIASVIDDIARKTERRLVAVSSVAIGADILFVETCLAKALPWIAILPMPSAQFFNDKDFPDSRVRAHAMNLLEQAMTVEVTNPINAESDQHTYRQMAFGDSGRRIVDLADVFIGAYRPTNEP